MRNGFKVDMSSYNEVAKSLGKVVKPGDYENILFVAEQLRFSDDQVQPLVSSSNCKASQYISLHAKEGLITFITINLYEVHMCIHIFNINHENLFHTIGRILNF